MGAAPYGWDVRKTLFVLSFAIGAVGAISLVVGWFSLRASFVAAGASILVASIVAATVATGMKTWEEEKKRQSDAKAREAYQQLAASLVARFSGGTYDSSTEPGLRGSISAWGAPNVVSALANWNAAYDEHVPAGSRGTVTLSADARKALRGATVAAIVAIRTALAVGEVDPSRIENALFNADDVSGI